MKKSSLDDYVNIDEFQQYNSMSWLVHTQKLYDTEYKLLKKGQVAQSALSCS